MGPTARLCPWGRVIHRALLERCLDRRVQNAEEESVLSAHRLTLCLENAVGLPCKCVNRSSNIIPLIPLLPNFGPTLDGRSSGPEMDTIMSFSVQPDKFYKSQAREQRARPADSMRLPPAPQLPKVRVGEPPSRDSRLFVGDIRRSQLRPSVPQIANDAAMHASDRVRASLAKRLSKTAVVVCFIVIAIGGLSLVLFPNAPREAVQSHTRSILATSAPQGATVSRREKYSPVKYRVGVPHPRRVEAGSTTTSSTSAEEQDALYQEFLAWRKGH
jgi:hypothetical protein